MPHLRTQKGIRWNYEIDGEGEGEPIVFLHGWGGDLRLWSKQAEYFSRQYQVIRIDLPGHGQSDWKKMPLPEMAQELEEILQHLRREQVNVIGSSLGGLIALQWFDLFPERFKRIAFVGALPKFLASEDYPYGLELYRLKKLDEQLNANYPAIVNIFFRSLFTRRERASSRFQYLTQFKKNDVVPLKDALHEFLIILEKEDLRETLQKINRRAVPVQVLNGADDYLCSKEAVGYLQKELPHARVGLFKDCGHFPFLTRPQEFNQALEDFLKTCHSRML